MEEQQDLLRRARAGDAEAFTALCVPFSAMVYRHCLQLLGQQADAQDAVQETMLRAYRAIPRFMGQSGIATWLYRIAHNTCLDMLKKPQRKRETGSMEQLRETGFEPPSQEDGPEAAYEKSVEAQRLMGAIHKLPQDQQTLLALRFGENYSYEELVKATGLPEGTVKSKLNRAKAKLQALLS